MKTFEQFLLRFENMFNVYIKKVKNPNSLININSFDNTFSIQPNRRQFCRHTLDSRLLVCVPGDSICHT